MFTNNELIGVSQLLKRLRLYRPGICRKTIYRMIQRGDIEYYNLGTAQKPLYMFDKSAADDYIAARMQTHEIE